MTKEELLDIMCAPHLTNVLNKFFESNVCIKKGQSPHPYADVLHEWIEGIDIQVKILGEWSDYNCSLDYIKAYSYRIKPSEPAWEYQWVEMAETTAIDITTAYYTEEEMRDDNCWVKIEETKRERKQ